MQTYRGLLPLRARDGGSASQLVGMDVAAEAVVSRSHLLAVRECSVALWRVMGLVWRSGASCAWCSALALHGLGVALWRFMGLVWRYGASWAWCGALAHHGLGPDDSFVARGAYVWSCDAGHSVGPETEALGGTGAGRGFAGSLHGGHCFWGSTQLRTHLSMYRLICL
jgi:hypothetical protein